MKFVEIGKVLRPKGIKGEIKIEGFTDDNSRFLRLKNVYIDSVCHTVSKARLEGAFVVIKLDGIDTPEQVDALRGKYLFIDRADAVKTDKDTNLIADIIGLEVVVGEKVIGKISDVLQYGAADVYVAMAKDKCISFPALKKLIVDVDIDGGKMLLDKNIFDEVAVFNEV